MIGVVIPAHNEEALVAKCLQAALAAAKHPSLCGEAVQIVVVLDDCTDGTQDVVAQYPVASVTVKARNVGAARSAGAESLLRCGARWLAFTDADSRVAHDWLAQQLLQGTEAVCGTVAVDDWSDHCQQSQRLEEHFAATYTDADGHRHVHGANLGISASAYRTVGGFVHLQTDEDVALVEALQRHAIPISWTSAPRVCTSARRVARAPGGFAAALLLAVDAFVSPTLVAD